MKPTLLFLVSVSAAVAGFAPHQRIDHEYKPTNNCGHAAITLGPGSWLNQPLYVVFEDDSMKGLVTVRSDIMFQKSTDAGRTWLPADVLVRRGSTFVNYPDIATDMEGNVYVVYTENDGSGEYVYCVQSTDGGTTWSLPIRVDDKTRGGIGSARIAADSAGKLLCAWNDWRTGSGHIWSSVSTDRGATWSPNVRVDDDTTNYDCYHADVFVQPATNHYLVVGEAPRPIGSFWTLSSYLYRSTDMGQTYQSGVRLDTFEGLAGSPHVVADAQHIVCDYTGRSRQSEQNMTEARTLYTEPDTWGSPSLVSRLDTTQFWSYYNGAKLAISGDGSVHTALMVCVDTSEALYLPYNARSSDHGVTWSELELVNDDTTANSYNPDIAADSAGNAYVVWQVGSGEVWFSTNNPLAIAEEPMQQAIIAQPSATVVRGVLVLGGNGDSPSGREDARYSPHFPVMSRAALLDIGGRKLMDLKPGANDVRALAPGVYFVKGPETEDGRPAGIRKVVVTR